MNNTAAYYLEQADRAINDAGVGQYYVFRRGNPPTDSTATNIQQLAQLMYQNDWNAEQNELAFERQKQLIQEQNEYNSPANQMARYMAAGLNPSVIYGQLSSGNQSQTAQYQPVKAATGEFKETSTQEKLNRTMSVISGLSDIIRTGAQLAGSIEGVRNQSLQNQILEAQLPMEIRLAQDRYNYYVWPDRQADAPDWDTFRKNILFPTLQSAQTLGSKANYQNWWNDNIADLYKSQFEGKAVSAEQRAQIDEYNRQMLESMPPAMRPYMMLFFQFLGALR